METQRTTYCFTYNNWTDDGLAALHGWLTEKCKYACYQKEIAPTTGTPHLQGYINLIKQDRMGTLHTKLAKIGVKLSLQPAKGTPQQNRTYCSKEGGTDFTEVGEIKGTGKGSRTDLDRPIEMIKNKRPLSEVAEECPHQFVRYNKGFHALQFAITKAPEEREMDVVVLYGDAGTGKSHKARMLARMYGPYFELEMPNGGSQWWDGYAGEKSIIIDEFNGWIKPVVLNKIMDKYRLKLPVKGNTIYAYFEHVFITSNYHPRNWWHKENVIWNEEALMRRINHMYEYLGNNYSDCTITKIK